MTDVNNGSYMADLSSAGDELVVFLIGMRVNKPWKLSAWWPVFTAMPKMLRYLEKHPEKGLLGYRQAFFPAPILVQYWWSFADLERFARDRDVTHLEPWRQFNRKVGSSGNVGIWHETNWVKPSDIETIYGSTPTAGLAAAVGLTPVRRGKDSAAARIGVRDEDDPEVARY